MYKINQEQFETLPDELKALYVKLPNPSSEEVRECFPETGKGGYPKLTKEFTGQSNITFRGAEEREERVNLDSGNPSRFFKSIIYQAKASKSERNKGCEELEEKETYKQDGSGNSNEIFSKTNKRVNPTTGELEERKETEGRNKNNHPTVKPIALMEYLIKMVTPKGGVVLDPFSGSFSTGVACIKNGFGFVGIEREEEYVVIGKARLEQAQKAREDEVKNVGLFQNL